MQGCRAFVNFWWLVIAPIAFVFAIFLVRFAFASTHVKPVKPAPCKTIDDRESNVRRNQIQPCLRHSRNTLALIRHVGIEPTVVEYLREPPDKQRLREAIAAAGISVRDAIRDKQPEYRELGLDDPSLSDDALLDAMVAKPRC